MLAAALAVIALVAIVSLVLGFPPVFPIIVLVLVTVPLFGMLLMRMLRHVPGGTPAPQTHPRVPTSAEASYQPVEDPRDRG